MPAPASSRSRKFRAACFAQRDLPPTIQRRIPTMRYMMFIKHTEDYRGKTIPPALMEAMGEFVGENMKNGKIVETNGLKSSHAGKKIRVRGGQLELIDGPFTESKEIVGGYAIVEAKP